MKQIITILALITFLGCGISSNEEINEPVKRVGFGELSTLQKNKTVTYEKDIEVKVMEILDSRCPINAVCVWEGEAKVKFEISDAEYSVLQGESQEFTFKGNKYRLELKDVVPFPTNENAAEVKSAVFTILEVK
jgi:hypothetical protein